MPDTDAAEITLDDIDRKIIEATQSGLPVARRPYHEIAKRVDIAPDQVIARMRKMQELGLIRRIGVVPNHYNLGYHANGMTVWDVPDDKIEEFGKAIGELDFVSHCYHRPRRLPDWPYNLFAMIHGRDRESTQEKVKLIAELLGEYNRGHDVLYSTRILKKTGLRI